MSPYSIGIDIGGTKVAYGLFDCDRKLIARYQHASDAEASATGFCDQVVGQVQQILQEHAILPEDLTGIGIAVPSFVLFEQGVIYKTANIPSLRSFPARDYFEAVLETKIVLDNDGNAAALAEHRHGAGRGFPHMIYCAVSTGLGSGIIINNGLFRGSYGFAGECGHMLVAQEECDFPCQCGNSGCFESHISGSKIVRRVAQRIRSGEKSLLSELCGGDLSHMTARHIKEGCDAGDPLAMWAVDHMANYLGMWLYNLYGALNINCFVFGGGLVNFGDLLFQKARDAFDSFNGNDLAVHFKFAELGGDFGIVGAAELLFDQ